MQSNFSAYCPLSFTHLVSSGCSKGQLLHRKEGELGAEHGNKADGSRDLPEKEVGCEAASPGQDQCQRQQSGLDTVSVHYILDVDSQILMFLFSIGIYCG